jgi:hypothetical protein
VDKTWCGNQQLLFFKDAYSTVFYVEAEMSVLDHTKSYINDAYPKIGIMMKTDKNYFVFYNIDCQSDYSNPVVGYVESNAAGTDYLWGYYASQSYTVSGLAYKGNSYAKLGVARIGDTLYLFANDKFVAKLEGELRGFTNDESTASAVAFLTYNTFTRFRNYSITTSKSEVEAKLASLNVTV